MPGDAGEPRVAAREGSDVTQAASGEGSSIRGIHHVTAITGDAQKNIDVYCGVLGLRLVKVTVNFDDPASYHLYYGDEVGSPGSIMTFFAWTGGRQGLIGPPQVTSTAFAVPQGALNFWTERLRELRMPFEPPRDCFGANTLRLRDPDGLGIELIELDSAGGAPRADGPVPIDYAIRGFQGVTISEQGYEATARILTETMGFKRGESDDNRFRYIADHGDSLGSVIDLLCVPDARRGGMGTGVVHHVAFRARDDAQQALWRERLVQSGRDVTPVMDRKYFKSIYFREPGGVLFEIATDAPGFDVDESIDKLGSMLCLPKQLEAHRTEIERAVPRISLPEGGVIPADE